VPTCDLPRLLAEGGIMSLAAVAVAVCLLAAPLIRSLDAGSLPILLSVIVALVLAFFDRPSIYVSTLALIAVLLGLARSAATSVPARAWPKGLAWVFVAVALTATTVSTQRFLAGLAL